MRHSILGYSLPEMLAVITVLTILSSSFLYPLGAGWYQSWLAQKTLKRDVVRLLSLIERARNLSVLSGHTVKLCGGELCDGQWSKQTYIQSSTSTLPLEQHIFDEKTKVLWRGFPSSRKYVLFLPSGLSSYQNGSFYLCHVNGHVQRISLNQSGRAYLAEVSRNSPEVCQ